MGGHIHLGCERAWMWFNQTICRIPEARYYGPNIIKVNLSMRKPFYFTEELQTMEGQETSVIGDMGAFCYFAV